MALRWIIDPCEKGTGRRSVRFLLSVLATLSFTPASAQEFTYDDVEYLNTFNRLFGDYYIAKDDKRIISREKNSHSFGRFYCNLKKNNWGYQFAKNLDDDPILGNPCPAVLTFNLKFRKGGLIWVSSNIPEPQDLKDLSGKEKKEARKAQKAALKASVSAQRKERLVIGKTCYFLSSNKLQEFVQNFQERKDSSLPVPKFDPLHDKNGVLIRQTAQTIVNTILDNDVKHVYFFAHGYNVPHSLAQMQGNRFISMINNSHPNEKVLFIRVFWEGGSRKELEVLFDSTATGFHLQKIVYRDERSAKNAKDFKPAKAEAVLCGFSLRRLLNCIASDTSARKLPFYFIAHSMGGSLTTAALINDLATLKYQEDAIKTIIHRIDVEKKVSWHDSVFTTIMANSKKPVGRDEARLAVMFMKYESPPDLNIRVFLNAPSLPGVDLFRFADLSKRYKFYIGHNLYDPALAKRFFFRSYMLSGFMARTNGNTSLGLNYENEVGRTEYFVKNNPNRLDHFDVNGFRTSTYFEHDVFFYMKHPLFNRAFNSFISSN